MAFDPIIHENNMLSKGGIHIFCMKRFRFPTLLN